MRFVDFVRAAVRHDQDVPGIARPEAKEGRDLFVAIDNAFLLASSGYDFAERTRRVAPIFTKP